ncbi:MAG: hypothetical protein Q9168_005744, partial [Polycauliona sp. 1 TL-2023]
THQKSLRMHFLTILTLAASSTLALAGTLSLHNKGHGCSLKLKNVCGCKNTDVTLSDSKKCNEVSVPNVHITGQVCGGTYSLKKRAHGHEITIDAPNDCSMVCSFGKSLAHGMKCEKYL